MTVTAEANCPCLFSPSHGECPDCVASCSLRERRGTPVPRSSVAAFFEKSADAFKCARNLTLADKMPNYISLSEAVNRITIADRILVVGCSGGGKTTLALDIADRFNLEYQSIDRDVRWLPSWKVRDPVEQRALIADLISRNRWVMDGSSPSTFDLRLPRADLVVWVRVPRRTALLGLAGRVMRNYRRVRVAMAEGCPEPIPDRAFLSYIWNFENKSAPRFVEQIDRIGPEIPVVILNDRKDGRLLLQ